MKTYDNLTKAEREKVQLFLQYNNNIKLETIIIITGSLIFFAIGAPLLLIFTIPIIQITGFLMIMFTAMFFFTAIAKEMNVRKHLFLIFGYKNTFEDIFDINRSDINSIKITKEVKWKWKKEN